MLFYFNNLQNYADNTYMINLITVTVLLKSILKLQ